MIRLAVSGSLLNDGSFIEGVGVIPDILVPLGDWSLRQSPYDIHIQAAIDFLITQKKNQKRAWQMPRSFLFIHTRKPL